MAAVQRGGAGAERGSAPGQAEKFGDLVRGVGTLYPGEGGELFASILKTPTVVDELKGGASAPATRAPGVAGVCPTRRG